VIDGLGDILLASQKVLHQNEDFNEGFLEQIHRVLADEGERIISALLLLIPRRKRGSSAKYSY